MNSSIKKSESPATESATKEGNEITAEGENKIVKRFGGRHLIFRQKTGGWWLIPKPYLLISSFRGPVWVFYGAGQIWFTHKKAKEIKDWIVRKPRFASKTVNDILNQIMPQIVDFIEYCNSQSIEGTLVIEKKTIEFHWTFGNAPLPSEKKKPEHSETIDSNFTDLVDAFLMAKKTLGV